MKEPHIYTRAQDAMSNCYENRAQGIHQVVKHTGLFPLMVRPSPDTAERVRLEIQAIPYALPPKKREAADG